jgi:uncharacterized lipoprotein YddW (UPF0748 family)
MRRALSGTSLLSHVRLFVLPRRLDRDDPSYASHTTVVAVVCAVVGLLSLILTAPPLRAQDGQYRAFWIDSFNTRLGSAADVTTAVERARTSGANAIFAQVRRRGDAWYVQGREPRPEGIAIDANFDPLAELIAQAHASGLELHAFVVVGAVWNQTTFPSHPQHVFNEHGFTPAGPRPGSENWLTRTRLPDGAQTSYGGYRFGSDFWLDFGHPGAATYTVDVLTDLVANYDVDGLHLDRLQYPEITGSGANVGYNDVSLDRFRKRHQRPPDSDPAPDDPAWSEWRRVQVTALMRRIYLNVVAIRPRVKVSVGVVANGQAPGSEDGWLDSDAYARVFQDWRDWMEEGVLDIAVPLAFRAEHVAGDAESFASWVVWTRDHQYRRQALMGIGAYLNSIEGTLRQIRFSLEPAGNPLDGVAIYSMGAHNAPVNRNPLAIPAGRDTPLRPFEDLSSGLRTGRTAAGQALEAVRETAATTGVFPPQPSPLPLGSRSESLGHAMGTITSPDGRPLDAADVVLESDNGRVRRVVTDGSGFYGAADLASGAWRVIVNPVGDGRYASDCPLVISAGQVARFDLELTANRPGITFCVSRSRSSRSR